MLGFFKKLILSLLALFIIFIIFAPTIISTKWGNRHLPKIVQTLTGYTLKIEKIHLSWLGSQELNNLELYDSKGLFRAQMGHFETKTPLARWLFGFRVLNDTRLSNFEFNIPKREKKPKISFKQTLTVKESFLQIPKLEGALFVENGKIVIEPRIGKTISAEEIHLQVTKKSQGLQFKAIVKQGGQRGDLSANGTLTSPLQIEGKMASFPLSILDSAFDTTEFVQSIGQDAKGEFWLKEKNGQIELHLSAVSDYLSFYLTGNKEGENFFFNKDSKILYVLTPAFFERWAPVEEKTRLADKNMITVEPISLNLSHLWPDFDYEDLEFSARFELCPLQLLHGDRSYNCKSLSGLIEKAKCLQVNFFGSLVGIDEPTFSGTLSLFDFENFSLQSKFNHLPVTLFEAFFKNGTAFALLGPMLDLEIDLNVDKRAVVGTVALKSERAELATTIEGDNFNNLHFDSKGVLQLHNGRKELFGSLVNVSFKGEANIARGKFSISELQGRARNDALFLDLNGKIGDSAHGFSPNAIELTLQGNILPIPLKQLHPELTLYNGPTLFVELNGKENKLTGNLKSDFLFLTFDATNLIQEGAFHFDKAALSLTVNAHQFPLKLVKSLMPNQSDLRLLFGERMDLNGRLLLDPSKEPYLAVDLDAAAEGFRAVASVQMDGTLIVSESKPTRLHWEITPERYLAFINLFNFKTMPTFLLSQTGNLDLTIEELICPKTRPKELKKFICESGFTGKAELSSLIFSQKGSQDNLQVDSLVLHIKGTDFSKALQIKAEGVMKTPYFGAIHSSNFTFDGQLLNMINAEGHFDRSNLQLQATTSIDTIPVTSFLNLLPIAQRSKEVSTALLGEFLSAGAKIDIHRHEGPILIDLKSSNLKVVLPFYLNPTNILTITHNIEAEISLTEEINKTFLKDINPMMLAGAATFQPIKCVIDRQGFMIPIYPFSFAHVNVESGMIDIGKILVANGGQVNRLLQFLKSPGVTKEGLMEAWFTPIYFQLRNGVVTYRRFDALLAGTVHLAFWGMIDLIHDRVDMTMAIAATSLQTRFNVAGISKKEMFHVKMMGSTSNVELDWSAASTRIGIIIASSEAAGQIGAIVGGILNQIISAMSEHNPTPAPTTQPFPWEK